MLYNVKAGIIGLGDLGAPYARLLKEHVKNLNLIAASGRSQKELLYAKNDLSLEYVYSDEKQIFDNHDIDALFIFSEARLRADQAIQAIEKGKHVFILNPLALNLDDALAVLKIAERHPSQVSMIASAPRSAPMLVKLKAFLDSGELGQISTIQVDGSFFYSMNKLKSSPSGSRFLDKLLDEIEIAQWIAPGEIEEIDVQSDRFYKTCYVRLKDALSYQFKLHNNDGKRHGFLNIYGEYGQILMSNDQPGSFRFFKTDGSWQLIELNSDPGFSFPEYQQLHHFTRTILGKEKNSLNVSKAVDSMRLALSFEKSDVLGKVIQWENQAH